MAGSPKLRADTSQTSKYGFNVVAVKIEPSTGIPILYAKFSKLREHRTDFTRSINTEVKNDHPKEVPTPSPSIPAHESEAWRPRFLLDLEEGTDYYDSEEL